MYNKNHFKKVSENIWASIHPFIYLCKHIRHNIIYINILNTLLNWLFPKQWLEINTFERSPFLHVIYRFICGYTENSFKVLFQLYTPQPFPWNNFWKGELPHHWLHPRCGVLVYWTLKSSQGNYSATLESVEGKYTYSASYFNLGEKLATSYSFI